MIGSVKRLALSGRARLVAILIPMLAPSASEEDLESQKHPEHHPPLTPVIQITAEEDASTMEHEPKKVEQAHQHIHHHHHPHLPHLHHHRRHHTHDDSDRPDSQILTIARTDKEVLVPSNDKLLAFRSLTGIETFPTLRTGHTARAASNLGIYSRVVTGEREASRNYKRYHMLIKFCLGAQIVVGAALTAIGASTHASSAVTAFGAINTIMAAVLTYLKGSGLPDKFKATKHEWKRMREHIEQREREFCLDACPLDVEEEVFVIESIFRRIGAGSDQHKIRGLRALEPQPCPPDQEHHHHHYNQHQQQQHQQNQSRHRLSALQAPDDDATKEWPSPRIPSRSASRANTLEELSQAGREENEQEVETEVFLVPPPRIVLPENHIHMGCPHLCEDCMKKIVTTD